MANNLSSSAWGNAALRSIPGAGQMAAQAAANRPSLTPDQLMQMRQVRRSASGKRQTKRRRG